MVDDRGIPDLLETIVAATRRSVEVKTQQRPLHAIEVLAAQARPNGGGFRAALSVPDRLNVIAECKRRSPSGGMLRANYDPTATARVYARGGAAAISVLTEPTFFDGALDHLREVRATVSLPLLCKDFIVSEYQVLEARAAGADAVLLIVAALADAMLARLIAAASERGLAALVEVHDDAELDRAVDADATIVGVNTRNLRTLEVRRDAAHALIERMPGGIVSVAESGLRTAADVVELRAAGYNAFLVGDALMKSEDPGATLHALVSGMTDNTSSFGTRR